MEQTIISNEKINNEKLDFARKVISGLQLEIEEHIKKGAGPFLAAIYDENNKLIAKAHNTVLIDKCSHSHAEMNVIRKAEEYYGTYDLSKYNLSLYVTAEPCIMCLGGIIWSGINSVYYGVPSGTVEKITGFDEGFKPNWHEEFKNRGITVYGNIEVEAGELALKKYAENGLIYKPSRERY